LFTLARSISFGPPMKLFQPFAVAFWIITCVCFVGLKKVDAQPVSSIPPAQPAAAATVPEPAPQELEKVEIKSTRETDTANGITRTIGSAELTKYGDDNVLDVLKRQPGISVTGGQISLRGIGSSFVRVLVDGQRPAPGFTLDSLSPQIVERIEVIPGSSVEFSAQSIGGTINIVLKRTRGSKQATASFGADKSSISNGLRATGTWGDTQGAWSWLITSSARFTQDTPADTLRTEVIGEGEVEQSRLRTTKTDRTSHSVNFSPRLTYTPSKDTRLQAQVGTWLFRNRDEPQLRTDTIAGSYSFFDQNNGLHADRGHGHWMNLELNQTINDRNKLEMKSRSGRWYSHHRFDRQFFTAVPVQRQVDTEDSRGKWFFLGATLRHSWNGDQNSSGGLEHERNSDKASRIDLLNSVSRLAASDQFEISSVRQQAGFLRHESQFSEAWATDLGVRWEQVNQGSYRQSLLAPSFQVQFKPNGSKIEQYRFELGRKWKPLRPQDLRLRRTFALDNRFETPDSAGNPDLVPEIALSADLAYTRRLGEDGTVGATLLAKKLNNIVQTRVSLQDNRWVSRAENVGAGSIVGVELEYKTRLSEIFADWPKTQVRANVGRYWSKLNSVQGQGSRVASQTPLSIGMGFDHKFAATAFTWGGNFKFTEKGLERINMNETRSLSNERNLNLYGLWAISTQLSARLALDNLLSRPNTIRTQLGRDSSQQIDIATTPVRPTIRLNVELKG
jgi:outer membrane receptor for ferrienterochelin and colicins